SKFWGRSYNKDSPPFWGSTRKNFAAGKDWYRLGVPARTPTSTTSSAMILFLRTSRFKKLIS
ncbi:hypothetical protein OAH86_10990, partial [Planktomarina temperata]|nr:hypothetical protein [Planktomarina temperata]